MQQHDLSLQTETQVADNLPSLTFSYEQHLANHIQQWLNVQDELLANSVIACCLALQSGHSCLLLESCAGKALLVDYGIETAFPALDDWCDYLSGLAIKPEDNAPIVFEYQRLYLRRYRDFEHILASNLKKRMMASKQQLYPESQAMLDRLFSPNEQETDWQQAAAVNSLKSGFSIITGGPGTGKTYTVARFLACYLAGLEQPEQCRIALAAPTGKAAQRLSESLLKAKNELKEQVPEQLLQAIPETASTLHRLLGVMRNSVKFKHNAHNQLPLDCLLVDEASMIDLPLMYRLFQAVPADCKVILLGDSNQLPSVAAGSVLADLTPVAQRQHTDYLVQLLISRRFDGKSSIGRLAEAVISGKDIASWQELNSEDPEVRFIAPESRESQLRAWSKEWYQKAIRADSLENAWQTFSQFRILCATRVGPQGVEAINTEICQQLFGKDQGLFKGLPVMITENNYQTGLFNGDIGILWPARDSQTLFAWFPEADGKFRPLPISRLPAWDMVFAMTIHKTQGSEFDQVAMLLPDEPNALLSRELVYTGLTRAKKHFSYCGAPHSWNQALSQSVERHSGLKERLFDQSSPDIQ